MGWIIALQQMGLGMAGTSMLALSADAAAQFWEVKVPKKLAPRGRLCGWMDGQRLVKFTLVPGLLQGMLVGFNNGWWWNDYLIGNALWPNRFWISSIINDVIILFVVSPVAFKLHNRPRKRKNFALATGLSLGLRILIQVICGIFR